MPDTLTVSPEELKNASFVIYNAIVTAKSDLARSESIVESLDWVGRTHDRSCEEFLSLAGVARRVFENVQLIAETLQKAALVYLEADETASAALHFDATTADGGSGGLTFYDESGNATQTVSTDDLRAQAVEEQTGTLTQRQYTLHQYDGNGHNAVATSYTDID